jgi:hypothetical protein
MLFEDQLPEYQEPCSCFVWRKFDGGRLCLKGKITNGETEFVILTDERNHRIILRPVKAEEGSFALRGGRIRIPADLIVAANLDKRVVVQRFNGLIVISKDERYGGIPDYFIPDRKVADPPISSLAKKDQREQTQTRKVNKALQEEAQKPRITVILRK